MYANSKQGRETSIFWAIQNDKPLIPGLITLVCRKLSENHLAILAWSDKNGLEIWRKSHPLVEDNYLELNVDELGAHLRRADPNKRFQYSIEIL